MPTDPLDGAQGWIDAWAQAQRAAVERWLGQGDTRAAEGLQDGLAGWWRLWGRDAGRTPGHAGETLQALGARYLKLLEQSWANLGDRGRLDPSGGEFQERLQQFLKDLVAGTTGGDAAAAWAAFAPRPGGTGGTWGPPAWPDLARLAAGGPWQTLFEIPTLGPAREQHSEWLRFQEALAAHQRLAADFGALIGSVHQHALELLRERVAARSRESRPVATFRELYELWIACGEEAFGKVAYSERYTRLQGALGQSDAHLRLRLRGLLERWLRALDLPTRPELDTTHRRVHDLVRRVEVLERSRSAVKDDPDPALVERVRQLEAEVARMRTRSHRAGAAKRGKESSS
jgi:class III poly(R)-hydroxyalkanoic acid synthase PhaE subunit